MDKGTKVKLTEKWWNDNKPKTLPEKGLGKALKDFDTLCTAAGSMKGPKALQIIDKALAQGKKVEAAARATAGACVKKLHDDTKHVLTKTFPVELAKAVKTLEAMKAKLDSEVETLSLKKVLGDRTLMALFHEYCDNNMHCGENTAFLMAYKKSDRSVYDNYVAKGSKFEINISDSLRKKFDVHAEAGTLKDAPWDDAAKECAGMVFTFASSRAFATWLRDEKKAKV